MKLTLVKVARKGTRARLKAKSKALAISHHVSNSEIMESASLETIAALAMTPKIQAEQLLLL